MFVNVNTKKINKEGFPRNVCLEYLNLEKQTFYSRKNGEVAEIWIWERTTKPSWTGKKYNTEILSYVKKETTQRSI